MDCVSDDGDAFIGYVASLRWRGLSLNYSSILLHRNGTEVDVNTTLQESTIPQVKGASIEWSSSRLDVAGKWEATTQPIKRSLLELPAGKIEWHCLHPRARAEICIGDGRRLEGLGYVEHLTMTIPPWRLPFDELRWGRFLSDEDSLVWINWRGAHSLNLIFHNGVQVENAVLSEHGLDTEDTCLDLGDNLVLREGELIQTALSSIPGIRKLFPFRILRTHERKWLSRGALKTSQVGSSTGWAIHEVVRWPEKSPQVGW